MDSTLEFTPKRQKSQTGKLGGLWNSLTTVSTGLQVSPEWSLLVDKIGFPGLILVPSQVYSGIRAPVWSLWPPSLVGISLSTWCPLCVQV